MPTDDPHFEQRLRDAAPAVDPVGVIDRVVQRRVRRRRTRRLELVTVALVVLLVVGVTTVLVTRDDGSSPHVAAPAAQLSARVVGGDAAVGVDAGRSVAAQPVSLDADPGALRGPLFAGLSALSLASYDRGPDGFALSHVVRVNGAHVVDVVNFKAQVISITEGEGARWALTRNLRATGGTVPDSFLKRIAADGTATSTQLPIDSDPVGLVAAVGGAVWVPVRNGVLQFDTSGNFVRSIELQPADTRSIGVWGKGAVVTDGNQLRRLDPATGTAGVELTQVGRFFALDGLRGRYLLERDGVIELGGLDSGQGRSLPRLPNGFAAQAFGSSAIRTWITGAVDRAPAIVLLDDRGGVQVTVILENASNGAVLAWTGAHTVTAVSGGSLYEIRVP